MQPPAFSRRDFVAAGSLLAASALTSALPGQAAADTGSIPAGMLNVRDFGAKGDGNNDDTGAIQKAMEKAALSNGAVFFPEGNYMCSELKVPPWIGLHGLPAWSYRKGMGSILTLMDETSPCLINLTGAFGAYLFGLCLNGNHLDGESHGILVDKPDYGIVLKSLQDSVIKDNVQFNGALKQLVADLGGHGDGVIIKDNVGSLRKIG